MLDDLRFRLRALFRQYTADDELRFHLERAVERNVAALAGRRALRRTEDSV